MNNDLKIKELELKDKIQYKPLHPSYGRAEFVFCPVFKYGKMKELFIFRRQQDEDENYHLDLKKLGFKKTICFDITSWSHKTDDPHIWRNPYCKEHKCLAFWVYVPNNTDTIEFEYHFGEELTIRFVKGETK
jgi:hypothetical protein